MSDADGVFTKEKWLEILKDFPLITNHRPEIKVILGPGMFEKLPLWLQDDLTRYG